MQEPGAFDPIPLMVTPWNLPRIRDLGRFYLTEARRSLSLMEEATDAHRQARQESKQGHRESFAFFSRLALHTHTIASDLFTLETTLGQQAALVGLVERYHASSEQEPDPVGQVYEQAAFQLCSLLLVSAAERRATLLIERAMGQVKQVLAARGRRTRPSCEECKRGEATRCQRGDAYYRLMQGQTRYVWVQRVRLPPANEMSSEQVRHLAASHAAAIAAAGDWHLHCYGHLHF